MGKIKTHIVESDILIVGGGMAGTGATFEARHWGRNLKIVCVEKANIDRSGAVAHGLYAINCLSLIHIRRCRRKALCRSRWSQYH